MKINKSVEQGIYVICILALQKGHTPVKSNVLSQLLQVSDSYLKKLLSKLVKSDLITSEANRSGGYRLAKPVSEISVYDVFVTLDREKDIMQLRHLSAHIFDDREHTKESEKKILDVFQKGFDALYQELKNLPISELLDSNFREDGYKDWNKDSSI